MDLEKNQRLIDGLMAELDSATEEQLEELREKYFKQHVLPKGWISIEDELPQWLAKDVARGYTEYKVKYENGTESTTWVTDPNTWYYYAKEAGITSLVYLSVVDCGLC